MTHDLIEDIQSHVGIRPHVKLAVNLVIADGHLNLPQECVGMYGLT